MGIHDLRPTGDEIRGLLKDAADHFDGNESALAAACGRSQNAIWQAKQRGSVTPALAIDIHRATDGKVPGNKFCPHIWSAPEHVPTHANQETQAAQ